MSKVATTACILDAHHGASLHYASWREGLSIPSIVVDEFDESWEPAPEVGVVVTLQHYMLPNVHILRRLVERNEVPVLIIADGILEYRNTWTRTDFPAGNIFQPVLGHKFACIGRSQARILESWGNIGKCEVVGLPRMDSLRGRSPRTRAPADPITILVMTAKTPGFNEEQNRAVLQSLCDLREWVAVANRSGLRYRVMWRLTGTLADELRIPAKDRDSTARDLAHSLGEADIVITTPSTAALEAMLCGIPVALLDYTNSPHYVQAAWTITARQHIAGTISDLVKRTPARMLWQDTILHDALECELPAADRMVQLVEGLQQCCQESRTAGQPLALPAKILVTAPASMHSPEPRFDFSALYPHHPIAGQYTEASLKLELGHAQLDRTRYLSAWQESLIAVGDLHRELGHRDARLHQLHQEVSNRDAELLRQAERSAEREAALVRQRDEIVRLLGEVAQEKANVLSRQSEIATLQHELTVLKAENLRLEEERATHCATIAELQHTVSQLSTGFSSLQSDVNKSSATIDRLQKSESELLASLKVQQDAMEGKSATIEHLKSREEEHSGTISTLRADIAAGAATIVQLTTEAAGRTEAISRLEKSSSELASMLDALNTEVISKDSEILALRQALSDLQKEAEDLRHEVSRLGPEVCDLNLKLSESQAALTESHNARLISEQRHESRRSEYENRLAEYERTITARIAGLVKRRFLKGAPHPNEASS